MWRALRQTPLDTVASWLVGCPVSGLGRDLLVFWALTSWKFALLYVGGILVHELGHAWIARYNQFEVTSMRFYVYGACVDYVRDAHGVDDEDVGMTFAGPIADILAVVGLAAYASIAPHDPVLSAVVFVHGVSTLWNIAPVMMQGTDGSQIMRAMLLGGEWLKAFITGILVYAIVVTVIALTSTPEIVDLLRADLSAGTIVLRIVWHCPFVSLVFMWFVLVSAYLLLWGGHETEDVRVSTEGYAALLVVSSLLAAILVYYGYESLGEASLFETVLRSPSETWSWIQSLGNPHHNL